jgi:hypothetical protein
MKDKEKQIIINEMRDDVGGAFLSVEVDTIEKLYDKGYRKLPEDSVVLSNEEYDCLKRIEKSYDPFWFCSFGGCEGVCKECKDTCEMSIFVKERKETAEKILKWFKENYEGSMFFINIFFKEQFGVEIKE